MFKIIVVFCLCSIFQNGLCEAQSVTVEEEPLIGRMMEKYVELNRVNEKMEGWRIQLLATTDRRRMEEAKSNFQAKYPYIPVDWVHASPYYKLQAGAFLTKLDASYTLQQLKRDFPSAYPAKDNNINPAELLRGNY